MSYCGHFLIKAEVGSKNYKRYHCLPLVWRSFTVAFVHQSVNLASKMKEKKSTREVGLIFSQTEELMYFRQEKSSGRELVTQIHDFRILKF